MSRHRSSESKLLYIGFLVALLTLGYFKVSASNHDPVTGANLTMPTAPTTDTVSGNLSFQAQKTNIKNLMKQLKPLMPTYAA